MEFNFNLIGKMCKILFALHIQVQMLWVYTYAFWGYAWEIILS